MPEKVVVTGGSGRVGEYIIAELAAHGYEVHNVDAVPPRPGSASTVAQFWRIDVTDYGEVMKPWRVMHLGRVFWRGVPRVLMLDDAGTLYFSTYDKDYGGRIYRLAPDAEAPVFTGATVPTQRGMDNDPLYENTITCAVRAKDGGFWCGTSVDGFLFKFLPSTSTVINKGKAFNYWELGSMAWGGDGRLYMLGGRDYDNPWLMCYDPATGSIDSLGWPSNYSQCGTICATAAGDIIIAENMRNSYLWVFGASR